MGGYLGLYIFAACFSGALVLIGYLVERYVAARESARMHSALIEHERNRRAAEYREEYSEIDEYE